MTNRRRLIVMRHAKAEPFAATDHARVLTEGGRRAATEAGSHLASTGAVPEYALVSTAVRAVNTWEAVALGSGSAAEPHLDGALYTGSPDVVLEALRAVPTDVEDLIVIGHNPTVAHLAHLVDDGHGEPAAVEKMLQGYPAGALTVLEVRVPWSELGPECARLTDFHVGRG
ncbi:MAG TPA: histidine phosphatase family protein [Nocardioidaceae bacterium]|nr:histidine phosphatase family protein [Nocardioidaceae bacterium]